MADIIDVNSFIGHWPLRPVSGKVSARLREMDKLGIARSWVSSLHGFLYDDPNDANEELFRRTGNYRDRFEPVPIVRPGFPLWREELDRYVKDWSIRMVRIIPGFYPWEPDTDEFREFQHYLITQKLVLLLQWRVEDIRSFHNLVKPAFISKEQLIEFAKAYQGKLIISGANPADSREILDTCGINVFLDIAFGEGMDFLETFAKDTSSSKRLLFSTMAPLLIPRASILKVQFSDISEVRKHDVFSRNAQRVFGTISRRY